MNEVYLITNRVNGKRYVGVTCRGYLTRFKEHILNASEGSKTILHNAIRKYGSENFDIILLEADVPDNLISEREKYYISLYNTFYTSGIGYNMTEGGGGVAGYTHTDASKSKISDSLKGHVFPESRNRKIKESMTDRVYRPEWREALSQARLGKFTGTDNPFFGRHHSEETKAIISKANSKGRVLQIDPRSNEILCVHKNLNSAGRWVTEAGLSKAHYTTCALRIGEVCRNPNSSCTAYGFHWKHEERSID